MVIGWIIQDYSWLVDLLGIPKQMKQLDSLHTFCSLSSWYKQSPIPLLSQKRTQLAPNMELSHSPICWHQIHLN